MVRSKVAASAFALGVAFAAAMAGAQCHPPLVDRLLGPTGASAAGNVYGALSISPDGNTAVVGHPAYNAGQGAAYVYSRTGTGWIVEATLAPVDESGPGAFGTAVELSGDGQTIIVGADNDACPMPNCPGPIGAAFVFVRGPSGWVQQGPKLLATGGVGINSHGRLGWSVALSADGNTALVGATHDNLVSVYGYGAAYVFVRTGTTWAQQGPKITVSDGVCANPFAGCLFGHSVGLSADGNTAVITAAYDDNLRGAVYFFVRSGTAWTQQGPKFTPVPAAANMLLGKTVSISADGNTVLAGAPFEAPNGAVYVYNRTGTTWAQTTRLFPIGAEGSQTVEFGWSVSLRADGLAAAVGAPEDLFAPNASPGAVYLFDYASNTWTQRGAKLTNCTRNFGIRVALDADGETLFAASHPVACTSEFCDGVYVLNIGPAGCRADFDCSGAPEVPDIFAFLRAWFSRDPRSDFNGVGCVSTADIFAFLGAWFAGC